MLHFVIVHLFSVLCSNLLYVYHNLFIHSAIHIKTELFQLLAVTNNVATNMLVT